MLLVLQSEVRISQSCAKTSHDSRRNPRDIELWVLHFFFLPSSTLMTMAEPGRIAQIVRLKRESLQAYKDCHAAVWPAVLNQIKDCNISDYSIFLDEDSMTLFATMKYTGTDFEEDMAKMKANPEVQRWWQMTDSYQETLVPGSKGSTDSKGWWKGLEEVFRYG